MADWKKVLTEIVTSVEAASRQANARQSVNQRRVRALQTVRRTNVCLFWDCTVPIRRDHIFCYEHYEDLQEGLIDECPSCGLAKDVQYEVCLDCYRAERNKPRRETQSRPPSSNTWYKPEYSPTWEKRDATADRFFVYILKLDGGHFYAGQTRELRERLSEHRDGRVNTTAGRHPQLVWFGVLPTREAATTTEVHLKKLVDSNPREVRRMVIGFRDLVGELDYT